MAELQERIKQWFANHYNRERFLLSMGERRIEAVSVNILVGFLAQGVAYLAYIDLNYLKALIEAHTKITKLVETLRAAGETSTNQFHYPLILGVMIEDALKAAQQLLQEDRSDDGDKAV